jgi:hypothetical protein
MSTEYMRGGVLGLGRPRMGAHNFGLMPNKLVTQHIGRFWMSLCFDDSRCLKMNLDLRQVPWEAL